MPYVDEEDKIHFGSEAKEEHILVTDCWMFLRNLIMIPDPRKGDLGFTDFRAALHSSLVRLLINNDFLVLLQVWITSTCDGETEVTFAAGNVEVAQTNSSPTTAGRRAHWVIFDLLYHFVLQLAPVEILRVSDSRETGKNDQLKALLSIIISRIIYQLNNERVLFH